MAAYYRGPFSVMLHAGFREGVAVINTMLNAAARHRVAKLTVPAYGTDRHGNVEDYEVPFTFGATEHRFRGDEHVWSWYRGISVGPYPCTSALQALELVCEQFITCGVGSVAEAAPGIAHPERRRWNLREVAMHLTVHADSARREEFRQVGQHLVERARSELDQLRHDPSDDAQQAADLKAALATRMAAIHGWAATLDAAQAPRRARPRSW
jgi:hypothetical protein